MKRKVKSNPPIMVRPMSFLGPFLGLIPLSKNNREEDERKTPFKMWLMPIYYGRVWWRHRYNWCSYCLGLVGTGVLGLREGRFRMAWPQDPVAAYPKECTFLTFTGPIRGHCDQIRGGIKLCGYSNSFNSATPQFSAVFAQFAPHTKDTPKIWVFQNSGVDSVAGWTSYRVMALIAIHDFLNAATL